MAKMKLSNARRQPSPVAKRRWLRLAGSLLALVCLGAGTQPSTKLSRKRFLLASDIHFNPLADPALVADLAAAAPGRWEAILNRSTLTAYSQYSQDTNWPLLQSALDAMRATLPHPALVMITGDLLAHGFPQKYAATMHGSDPEQYRAFVLKTVEFIALELRKRFPTVKILLTPGNNDDDCGDYEIEAGGPFLSDTADVARSLAQADDRFTDDWKHLGSYSVQNPALRGARILSLNTVFFSNKYHAASLTDACSQVSSAAASDALAWLKSNLAQAREAHEKVWLMLHIPPGIDGYSTMVQYQKMSKGTGSPSENVCAHAIVPMWSIAWTAQFDSLLKNFQDTVAASFAGHDHTDDFRLISSAGSGEFVLIDPPVSPIYGQNPGFRIVTFSQNADLTDQSTYYLTNLKAAGSKTPGKWMREYRFSQQWRQPRLDAHSLRTLYDRITDDPETRVQWLRLYNVSSPVTHVDPTGARALHCASGSLDPASYQKCYCPVTER